MYICIHMYVYVKYNAHTHIYIYIYTVMILYICLYHNASFNFTSLHVGILLWNWNIKSAMGLSNITSNVSVEEGLHILNNTAFRTSKYKQTNGFAEVSSVICSDCSPFFSIFHLLPKFQLVQPSSAEATWPIEAQVRAQVRVPDAKRKFNGQTSAEIPKQTTMKPTTAVGTI